MINFIKNLFTTKQAPKEDTTAVVDDTWDFEEEFLTRLGEDFETALSKKKMTYDKFYMVDHDDIKMIHFATSEYTPEIMDVVVNLMKGNSAMSIYANYDYTRIELHNV